jgi:hypothetical protein
MNSGRDDIPPHCRAAADQCYAAVAAMFPPDAITALVEALCSVLAHSGVPDVAVRDLVGDIASTMPGRVALLRKSVKAGRQ